MGMPLGKMGGCGAAQLCPRDAVMPTIDELTKQFVGNSTAQIARIETTSLPELVKTTVN
jgi:hypothetical protein